MNSVVVSGFIIGLASSLHCIGMCGPLALAIPLDYRNTKKQISGSIQYNTGRIASYSFLGLIVGLAGVSLKLLITFQIISIASGILMLLFATNKFTQKLSILRKINNFLFSVISNLFGKIRKSQSSFKPTLFGIVNGLLPCGMVYISIMNALTAENLLFSILSMTAFGVGTFFTMFFIPILYNISSLKNKFQKLTPIVLLIVGLVLILRGMNLGIPFISPEIQIEKVNKHSLPSINCCKPYK